MWQSEKKMFSKKHDQPTVDEEHDNEKDNNEEATVDCDDDGEYENETQKSRHYSNTKPAVKSNMPTDRSCWVMTSYAVCVCFCVCAMCGIVCMHIKLNRIAYVVTTFASPPPPTQQVHMAARHIDGGRDGRFVSTNRPRLENVETTKKEVS